jgi:hypothetical protein
MFRLSEHQISACAKLEPKVKYSWWNSKENTEFTFVGATQKIKQSTKSKTNRLVSNDLLQPTKRQKRRVCWDPAPPDTPSDSDTELAVPCADDSTEEEEQDADCVYCTGRFS